MQIEVVKADFGNDVHRLGIVEVLDSYASDPVGGGQPLTADVRTRLVPLLRDHPSTLVLLALAEARVVGIAVCFLNLSTFRARPVLHVGDLAVLRELRGKGVGRALLASRISFSEIRSRLGTSSSLSTGESYTSERRQPTRHCS